MPTSTGLNRWTGQPLSDWDHVVQSIEVIFSTPIGSRVMRRTVGSMAPKILGRPLVDSTVLRFFAAIVMAIELWEPRFAVTGISPSGTPDGFRKGKLGLGLVGQYRPNALLGDFTPAPTPMTITL